MRLFFCIALLLTLCVLSTSSYAYREHSKIPSYIEELSDTTIKQLDDHKKAVEKINILSNSIQNDTQPLLFSEASRTYATLLLKFLCTGMLHPSVDKDPILSVGVSRYFANEEERRILSIAIARCAAVLLADGHTILDACLNDQKLDQKTKNHIQSIKWIYEAMLLKLKDAVNSNDDGDNYLSSKGERLDFNELFKNNAVFKNMTQPAYDKIIGHEIHAYYDEAIKNFHKDSFMKVQDIRTIYKYAFELPNFAIEYDRYIQPDEKERIANLNLERVYNRRFSTAFTPIYSNNQIPSQGWKLHVSASLKGALDVAKLLIPFLKENKIESKIVKNFESFLTVYYTTRDDTQYGKFITIYSKDENDAGNIARDIDKLLQTLPRDSFVSLRYDAPLGSTGGIWTRYGKLTAEGGYRIDVINPKGEHLKDADGKYKYDWDDRSKFKPDFLTWHPFGNLWNVNKDPKYNMPMNDWLYM